MEPPSPLIYWVNPFPSRYINRTACFPRKVSYFRESRMSPWKKWSWMKSNCELRSPSFDRFPFLLYVHFYSFTAAGIWDEIKVNELPAWDWAWSDGIKAANWGSRKGSTLFFFAVIHPTFKHAPWKESTIKRSVDDLKLFDDQRRKSARIIWFLSSPWSGFWISPVKHRVQKRWPK